jgi:hypothetical protein
MKKSRPRAVFGHEIHQNAHQPSNNNLIMVSPTAATIDREWARSLIGLRLKVEACWWPEFSGHELYPGVIEDFDFDAPNDRFFIFRIDGDEWTYNMRYDAVVHYADEEHPSFHTFRLPDGYMQDPTTEEVTLAQLQQQINTRRQRNVRLHDDTALRSTPETVFLLTLG